MMNKKEQKELEDLRKKLELAELNAAQFAKQYADTKKELAEVKSGNFKSLEEFEQLEKEKEDQKELFKREINLHLGKIESLKRDKAELQNENKALKEELEQLKKDVSVKKSQITGRPQRIDIEKVIELRKEGNSLSQIAKIVNADSSAISRLLKKYYVE